MIKPISSIDEKNRELISPYISITIETNNEELKKDLTLVIVYFTLADAGKTQFNEKGISELVNILTKYKTKEDIDLIKVTLFKMIELGGIAKERELTIRGLIYGKTKALNLSPAPDAIIIPGLDEPKAISVIEETPIKVVDDKKLEDYYIYKQKAQTVYETVSTNTSKEEITEAINNCRLALDELKMVSAEIPQNLYETEKRIIDEWLIKLRRYSSIVKQNDFFVLNRNRNS